MIPAPGREKTSKIREDVLSILPSLFSLTFSTFFQVYSRLSSRSRNPFSTVRPSRAERPRRRAADRPPRPEPAAEAPRERAGAAFPGAWLRRAALSALPRTPFPFFFIVATIAPLEFTSYIIPLLIE